MECYRTEAGGQCFGRCLACAFGECALNDTFLNDAAAKCLQEPTDLGKIICSGREIKRRLPGAYVCRHHAACHIKVLAMMRMQGRYGAGFLDDGAGGQEGHAWMEVQFGGRLLIADAYNDIYYTVPR